MQLFYVTLTASCGPFFHADSVGHCLEQRGEVITPCRKYIVYRKKGTHALKLVLYNYNIAITLRRTFDESCLHPTALDVEG